ncbi:MAG: hypothetical protein WA148_01950 [Actinomycetota bacterium]
MDRVIRIVLVVIAAISLILGVAALFFPIKLSFVRGTYGLSYEYKSQWYTLAYNSVGGYLLLLAGLVNAISSVRLFQRRYGPLKALFWALFSGVLVVSFYLAGKTVIINWASFLPVEIQQGIGSPYVQLREVYLTTAPQVLAAVTTIIFITLVFINYFLSFEEERT